MPQLALLVDPHADTRQLYRTYLTPHRYIIEEASDGREALAKAITDRPDIVVTETLLEGMDGFGLCETLRTDRDTRDIPIIVLTGDAREANRERAFRSGADVVLVKPCLPEALLNNMRQVRARAADLRRRVTETRSTAERRLQKSAVVVAEVKRIRKALSKSVARYETTSPAEPPPALTCPWCMTAMLQYERTFIGGVSEKFLEQWDQMRCPTCGAFQYRHRTRKLTKILD